MKTLARTLLVALALAYPTHAFPQEATVGDWVIVTTDEVPFPYGCTSCPELVAL